MCFAFNFFFLILTPINICSQETFLGHVINFSPEKAPKKEFNAKEYRDLLKEKYSKKVKKTNELNEFVNWLVLGKERFVNSNYEYEFLDSAVNYLTKITSLIFSESDVKFKIKLVRDAALNACAFEDGTIYVNIGMIAAFDNEAELAAVLGHEIGHVLKQHALGHYKAYKKIRKNLYFHNSNSSMLVLLASNRNASNKMVKQEKQSDDLAIKFLNTSNYNNRALSSVERKLFDQQKKVEANVDSRRRFSLFYLNTHPSAKSRIRKTEKVKANLGKNFLIDSVYFLRLKQMAIDECINELFVEQNYETCNEWAFNEHLKKPQDPFYLFYVTESVRRLIAIDSSWKNMEYISSNYKKSFCKIDSSVKDSVILFAHGTYSKVASKKINSILLKLNGPILGFNPGESNVKYSSLSNSDTLEFLTFIDALNYFQKLNQKNGFLLNNLFLTNNCPTLKYNTRESFFYNLKCNRGNFNENTKADYLFLLGSIDHVKGGMSGFSTKFEMEHSTDNEIFEYIKKADQNGAVSFGEEMNYNDVNLIKNQIYILKAFFTNVGLKKPSLNNLFNRNIEDFKNRSSAEYNVRMISPELLEITKKYGLKGIIFSEIDINETSQKNFLSNSNSKAWNITHYYLDVFENKIKFYNSMACYSQTASMMNMNMIGALGLPGGTVPPTDLNKCFYESLKDAIEN